MTGHAFQVFVEYKQLRASLGAIRSALTDEGRFVFEIRNPLVRAWDAWTPDNAVEIVDDTGAVVRMAHEVETPVDGNVVSFTITFSSPGWDDSRMSKTILYIAMSLDGFVAGQHDDISWRQLRRPRFRYKPFADKSVCPRRSPSRAVPNQARGIGHGIIKACTRRL